MISTIHCYWNKFFNFYPSWTNITFFVTIWTTYLWIPKTSFYAKTNYLTFNILNYYKGLIKSLSYNLYSPLCIGLSHFPPYYYYCITFTCRFNLILAFCSVVLRNRLLKATILKTWYENYWKTKKDFGIFKNLNWDIVFRK